MTIYEHTVAGAHSGSWPTTSPEINDLTYGFFTGTAATAKAEVATVDENVLQQTTINTVTTMARKTLKAFTQFGERTANNALIYLGHFSASSIQSIPHNFGGWPMVMDNQSTGDPLTTVLGFVENVTATGVKLAMAVDLLNSTGYTDDTVLPVGDVLPDGLIVSLSSEYGAAPVTIGNSVAGYEQTIIDGVPSDSQISITAPELTAFSYLTTLLPIKHYRKTDSVNANVSITDSSKGTPDFDLDVVAGDKIMNIPANTFYTSYQLAVVNASGITADVITHDGFPIAPAGTEAYYVIDGLYAGTCTATHSPDTSGLLDSAQTGWTDAGFTADMETGNFMVMNLATSGITKITGVAGSGDLELASANGNAHILHSGIRADVLDQGFTSGDQYLILPFIDIVATYTDPSGGGGGGGATEYLAEATAVTAGEEFDLASGASRRFYTSGGLRKGEFLEAQVKRDQGRRWASLGRILVAEGKEAGIVANDTDTIQTYRVIKSKTAALTSIRYD